MMGDCMKRKMKSILFGFSMLAVLTMNACTPASDPGNVFEMETTATKAHSLSETNREKMTDDSYAYGNMQINAPAGNFMDYQGKIVFLKLKEREPGSHTGSYRMYELDEKTGEVTPFNPDPTNPSAIPSCFAVEEYQGELYALNTDWKIMKWKDGEFVTISDGTVYNFWHGDGRLFAVSRDSSLVEINEKDGKSKILIGEYTDYHNLVIDGWIYGLSWKGLSRVSLSKENPEKEIILPDTGRTFIDGRNIYFYDQDSKFCRCNLDGSDKKKITEDFVRAVNFDDEYLYFTKWKNEMKDQTDLSDGNDLWRMSKSDPGNTERIATIPDASICNIYVVPGYDRLIVEATVKTEYNENEVYVSELFLVPKSGSGETVKLELPD